MTCDGTAPGPGLLENKVELLRQLAGSLEAAQAAVVHHDLAELRRETARQERICGQFRQLEAARLAKAEAVWGDAQGRREELQGNLARVKLEVTRLNRIYGALLRRASRTVNIFCRALVAARVTYDVPQSLAMPSGAQKE